jgi:PhoH-like ATPase
MSVQKIFVLDTNVVLHDSSCIHQFDEHDVVIPITVIEELDSFKKGDGMLNYHAREFIRSLDSLCKDRLFNGGIALGEGKGSISVKLESAFHEKLKTNFSPAKADHHILNSAYYLAIDHPEKMVVLVTKDVNLRMKAKSIGLMAEDYTTDHVKNILDLYKGTRVKENVDGMTIDRLYEVPFEVMTDEIVFEHPPLPNEYLVLRNGKKSALGKYDPFSGMIRRIDKTACCGIMPRNAEQAFALDALTNMDIPLVTISGKAGTGKTLLALAAALERKRHYRQIFVARPVVPLSNKDIGFLPGDIQSKLDPYMQPLYDNLAVIQHQSTAGSDGHKKISDLLNEKKMVITPLTYIRGRSLVKVFFIVDEAQNLTPHEIKTIITRAGEKTKMVFTGDVQQIDHPYLDRRSNGLSYLIEKMKDQRLAAHINLEKGERSELSDLVVNLL